MTKRLIYLEDAIDALDVGAELLKRVLDDTDVVGAKREKYQWGLELIESCISDMKELSSVQTERLTGRWIENDEYGSTEYTCSACHCREYLPNYNGEIEPWRYCPNCGADMRGAKKMNKLTNEEAIEWLSAMRDRNDYQRKEALDIAIEALSQPERKKGRWIAHEGCKFVGFPYMHYECDHCRAFEPTKTNFCPNCGADMRGESDE